MTHSLLWPEFVAQWPLMSTPDGQNIPGPEQIINPWHLPLINTVLLISSSVTLTFAHHASKKKKYRLRGRSSETAKAHRG
eukprot:TRINITY_DN4428_c0_g1_i1.p1 TRINITY_DN4428_c0_g1~~TRINITY_DN4428_c0_g1_i1.p1  ORF type:complete len:93 (+),score=14.77 TRINITY_DN4428_c0_g1_i1:42-281(+)